MYIESVVVILFFFSSRRRHTRYWRDWSSDVCSSDLGGGVRWRRGYGSGAPVGPARATMSGGDGDVSATAGAARRGPVGVREDRERGVEGKGGDLGGGGVF